MYRVFIDGHVGTTGLEIHERLRAREEIELVSIDDAQRKSQVARAAAMAEADVVILCLPDDAARESVTLAGDHVRFIDASTAHRTNPDWVYGMPELRPAQRAAIAGAGRVSNPGCWPTGFLAATVPLVESGVISKGARLSVNGVSGYSGGGRDLIERYREKGQSTVQPDTLWHGRPYALTLQHKHLPEMQAYSGLDHPPLFAPSVGHYHRGMLVSIPLFSADLNLKSADPLDDVYRILATRYEGEPCVRVHRPNDETPLDRGFLNPQANNGTNRLDLHIFGHAEQFLLISVLDNLGKGASGAAVQNLNLMLGLPELAGLVN